jgi:adenosine/AMP kinase
VQLALGECDCQELQKIRFNDDEGLKKNAKVLELTGATHVTVVTKKGRKFARGCKCSEPCLEPWEE